MKLPGIFGNSKKGFCEPVYCGARPFSIVERSIVEPSVLCMFVNCWHGLLCSLLLLVTLANTLPLSNTFHNGLQAGQRHLFNYNDPGHNDVDNDDDGADNYD